MEDHPSENEYKTSILICPVCNHPEANMISHLLDIPYYDDFMMITINCPKCGFSEYEVGEFIIISGIDAPGGIKKELHAFLPEGSEKRIVIHLSGDITPNDPPTNKGIALNSQIRVVINSSAGSTQLLLVPAGRLA